MSQLSHTSNGQKWYSLRMKDKSKTTTKKAPKTTAEKAKELKISYALEHRPLNFLRKSLEKEDYCLSRL